MANWKKTVDVNGLLKSFQPEEGQVPNIDVPKIAAALVELLDRKLPEYMEEYGESLREMAEETVPEYMSIEEFDYELHGLYDYADNCLIWLGF